MINTNEIYYSDDYNARFTRYDAVGCDIRVLTTHEWARGYAFAKGQNCLNEAIKKVHDIKGNLTVTWLKYPSEQQMLAYDFAWEHAGEDSAAVEHELYSVTVTPIVRKPK